jgi:large subunit ribosomal protein L10
VLADFVKEYQKMTLKAGYFEGRVFSDAQVREIAALPPREVLLGQVIGAVQAPIAQLIWCIESVLRNVVSVVDEAGKKKALQ